VKSVALCSTFDVISFDQNWHRLYSSSAGEKCLSNDAQIRLIGSMGPEIGSKMLKNLSEKLRTKFPSTTLGYSVGRIACLDDAFSGLYELEASPVEGLNHCSKKMRKEEKGKAK